MCIYYSLFPCLKTLEPSLRMWTCTENRGLWKDEPWVPCVGKQKERFRLRERHLIEHLVKFWMIKPREFHYLVKVPSKLFQKGLGTTEAEIRSPAWGWGRTAGKWPLAILLEWWDSSKSGCGPDCTTLYIYEIASNCTLKTGELLYIFHYNYVIFFKKKDKS